MILFKGSEGDIIIVEHEEKIDLDFHRIEQGHCLVHPCLYGHLYGYNFCSNHQWLLPIGSHEIKNGFQVAFINYWRKQGKKVIQTNQYEGKEK